MTAQFRNYVTKFQLLKAVDGIVSEVIATGWCQHQTSTTAVKGGKLVQVGHSPTASGEFNADGEPLYDIKVARIDPATGEGIMGDEGITARVFAYNDGGPGLHEPLVAGDILPEWVIPPVPASAKKAAAKKAPAARKSTLPDTIRQQLADRNVAPLPAPTQAEKAEAEAKAVTALAEELNAAIEAAPTPTKGKGK